MHDSQARSGLFPKSPYRMSRKAFTSIYSYTIMKVEQTHNDYDFDFTVL